MTEESDLLLSQGEDFNDGGVLITVNDGGVTYYWSQGEGVNDGGVRLITVAKERTSMTEESDLLLEPRRGRQ